MRDIRKIIPDIKLSINLEVENRISDLIPKEYPEIIEFSVKYDVDQQKISFTGLTSEQDSHVLRLATEGR